MSVMRCHEACSEDIYISRGCAVVLLRRKSDVHMSRRSEVSRLGCHNAAAGRCPGHTASQYSALSLDTWYLDIWQNLELCDTATPMLDACCATVMLTVVMFCVSR